MTTRTRTMRQRTFDQLVDAVSPTEQQEPQQHDPMRLLLGAIIFVGIVGVFLLFGWRAGQGAKVLPGNRATQEAMYLYKKYDPTGTCPDFVAVERSYGWYVYCAEDKPTWLTEHAE